VEDYSGLNREVESLDANLWIHDIQQESKNNYFLICNIPRSIEYIICILFFNRIMVCKGMCVRHKAGKPFGINSRYDLGQKRCSTCEIYINWDGKYCTCCSSALRTKPKAAISSVWTKIVSLRPCNKKN